MPQGARESAALARQIGEDAIAAFGLQIPQALAKEELVIHTRVEPAIGQEY
jgi:hypothetical protein